jgi:hypothetical protein
MRVGRAPPPEITMFTLYYAPNTCALAAHIALAPVEASAPYAFFLDAIPTCLNALRASSK